MRGLLVVAALTLALSASPASAEETLSLPAPTGRQPVGATTLYLKDTSRPDTWVPSVPYRELMVSVHYPATSANGPAKPFMTTAEAAALLEKGGLDFGADTPAERGNAITRAYVRAFFDLHLRGCPQPLMTASSARYPEVTFIG